MTRPAIAALALFGLLAVSAAAPVLAKDGGQARIYPPIDRGSEPGSTIDVGFDAFTIDEDGTRVPWTGTPMSIWLVPVAGAEEPEHVLATEEPAWSGHYVATLTVPSSGIADVAVGIRGESCVGGVCTTNDLPLAVTPGSIVGDVPVPAVEPAGAAASPATVPADEPAGAPATSGGPEPLLPIVLGLVVAAGVLAVAALALTRRPARRHSREVGPT